jgi:hypothetical protein
LSYLIIEFHNFIQFAFDRVTTILWSGCRFCMLTQVGSGWVFFLTFFNYIFFLILSFKILFARNWTMIFFFHFVLYGVITFLFNFFLRYQIRSFNFWFLNFFFQFHPSIFELKETDCCVFFPFCGAILIFCEVFFFSLLFFKNIFFESFTLQY